MKEERSHAQTIIKDNPDKILPNLRKNVAKYEENVNKCDIFTTNVLSSYIGEDINFLNHHRSELVNGQKLELEHLENQFSKLIDSLSRCRCVKRLEK